MGVSGRKNPKHSVGLLARMIFEIFNARENFGENKVYDICQMEREIQKLTRAATILAIVAITLAGRGWNPVGGRSFAVQHLSKWAQFDPSLRRARMAGVTITQSNPESGFENQSFEIEPPLSGLSAFSPFVISATNGGNPKN